LEKRLKPLGTLKEGNPQNPNFFKQKVEINRENIKEEIEETTKGLLKKALFTKKIITDLDRDLLKILPG
jgi:hypothetical protein